MVTARSRYSGSPPLAVMMRWRIPAGIAGWSSWVSAEVRYAAASVADR